MTGPLYACDPADAVDARALDGVLALYHIPSGATHLLVSPAPEILDCLRAGPVDAAGLIALLGAQYGLQAEGDVVEVVTARLYELIAAGLVWRT